MSKESAQAALGKFADKKAKNKSPAERDISYEIPVLRSEAFARALSEAKLQVVGSGGLRSLFERATASVPLYQFKENWPYLQTMLRLVGAYERGQYKQVSNDDLMWIVAALNYLVDPFDLIPDTTPLFGFVDDAIVVGFVADKTRQALDDFIIWETQRRASRSPFASSSRPTAAESIAWNSTPS